MREQHILVIFGIFFWQCLLLLLLCVESTTRWMLTCDSIFQIIDMEMKLNKFFSLPFPLSLFLSLNSTSCSTLNAHVFSVPFFDSWPHWMWTIYVLHLFFSFNSLNAHFMSKIVNWHESKASYCIMRPSTIWLHPIIFHIISHSFRSQLSLEVVSFASRNGIEFPLAYVSHTRLL